MQQLSIFGLVKLKKRDHQRNETCKGQYIKKRRHVVDMP